jgi:serine/threonine-protein kinase RsbW
MIYTTTVSCEKSNLKSIREFVIDTLNQYNLAEEELNLVVLAIDEVCSNLIIHSHRCNKNETIEVRIQEKGGKMVFEILDKGEIFNISEYQVPTMDKIIQTRSTGGIGLILVKTIMDKIEIENGKGVNICRLFKKLS